MRTVNDSIRVIKDIRMQALEPMFVNYFQVTAREYARGRTLSDLAGIMPKYIIEVFAIAALVFVIIFLISSEQNTSQILPILGVYAFAGFRLMPAMQQIFLALSKIQFSSHSLKLVADEIKNYQEIAYNNEAAGSASVAYEKSFGLDQVSFSYGEGAPVIKDVTLNLNKSEKIGIIGKSGGGKSTIIDLLVGLTVPSSGNLVVDGEIITSREQLKGWRSQIAYTSQSTYLLDDSIDMNITLEADTQKRDVDLLNMAKSIANVDFDDGKLFVGENGQRLSGGQKQRVGLARALYQNKPILVLDEATSAMDSDGESKILEGIAKLDKTLIYISHRVETLKFCDRICVVADGRIVDNDTYSNLSNSSDTFKVLLQSSRGDSD
jgi:ABC-type bacteriocin/lantibiotic exporter with double-glycine peptidase domain